MHDHPTLTKFHKVGFCSKTGLYVDGLHAHLGRKDCALMQCLINRPNEYVSRADIYAATKSIGRVNALSRAIDVSVSRIRRALGPEAWRIQCANGTGYRFSTQAAP